MNLEFSQVDIVRKTISNFCLEYIRSPYLCYTEHGQHALFYAMLYNAISEERKHISWYGQKVCVIQKEYPTCGNLGKPQRQHWDIAVIKDPPESNVNFGTCSYDYLRLAAVVEFGMNASEDHLIDDINRLSHRDSNIEQGFLVHLYRLSNPSGKFSHRDWSPNSVQIISPEQVAAHTVNSSVEVFYALVDSTSHFKIGAYKIKNGHINLLEC